MFDPAEPQLLRGTRILSLAEQYPGPYATLVLADLGADVIQVERPDGGDPARQFPGFYAAIGRNKRSVAFDLKADGGAEKFLALAADSDVVIEGFRPGTVDRLGVGYEQVKAVNPSVIYLSISGYGQAGPYRDRPGHDIAYQAVAGLLAGQTHGDGADLQIGDLAAGMFAAIGVTLGLLHRERTGSGLYIDVSMLDVLVSMNSFRLVPTLNDLPEATFSNSPGYGRYKAGDGKELVLGIAHEDKFWQGLCDVVGLVEFRGLVARERLERTEELRERLASELHKRTRDEWVDLLVTADVPVAPVHTPAEVEADPQVVARALVVDIDGSGHVAQRHIRQPLVIPGFSSVPTHATPALGEHTTEVFESAVELTGAPERPAS